MVSIVRDARVAGLAVSLICLSLGGVALAAPPAPLHQRIDVAIGAAYDGPVSPQCDDAEFIRRVHLDLLGIIPTADEVRAFLADDRADKRTRLVDSLFDRPEHPRHLMHLFDTIWMERRASTHVKVAEWQAYLRQAFAANKPYNELVREILAADGVDPAQRGAARFLLDRECEPNAVTRDVGRMFFGRDMQCAQCHDHPLVDDYLQSDYHGLYAFVSRLYVFRDAKKVGFVAEKPDGEVSYTSVFTGDADERVAPRLPAGEPVPDPELKKGEEYEVAPAKGVRPVPKYSRREELARRATDGSNPAFNRTIVNRLWAHMFGRGIVDPVEFDHAGNPPSHPELLDELAGDFAAHDFDLRYLLREIALSETYQRSSVLPESAEQPPADRFATMALKPLAPEALALSGMQATGTWSAREVTARAALEKKPPEALAQATDDERPALLATLIEEQAYNASASQIGSFVSLYASAADEDFQATVNQALFFGNGPIVDSWLKPSGNNLTARVAKLATPDEQVDELFLSVLSRYPSQAEREAALSLLSASDDARADAVRALVWGLLSSTEFRFNH